MLGQNQDKSSTKDQMSTSQSAMHREFYSRPLLDRYQCQWCEKKFVVPSMTLWHEERTCEARPAPEGDKEG